MRVVIAYPPFTQQGRHPHLGQNRQFRFTYSQQIKIYPLIPAMAVTLLYNHGFDTLYLDGINVQLSMEEFMKEFYDFQPELAVLETKAPIIKEHWKFIDNIKRERDIRFVLVGDHISFFPKESLQNSKVDYCLAGGDYDVGILRLVQHLEKNSSPPKGLYYRENGEIKDTGKFELIEDLDSLPFINRDLTQWKIYGEAYLYRPCTYILSGRGCGGGSQGVGVCKFCIWQHAFWNCSPRLRSPKNVVEEIEILFKKYGVREIFDDNESGAVWNKDWLKEFYDQMRKNNLIGKVILSSNARADSLDKETCLLLKKMGFRLLKVGLESGNDQTLMRLNKRETLEQIKEGVKTAKDYGLRVMLTIMVGYPWENEDDIRKTYQVAKELTLYKMSFGDSLQASIIIPYPGTPLYKEALENNWFNIDPKDYSRFDMSKPVLKTDSEAITWCRRHWQIHRHPLFLFKSLVSLRSFSDLALAWRGIRSLFGHEKDYG